MAKRAALLPTPGSAWLQRVALDLLRQSWTGADQKDHEALLVHATGNKPRCEDIDVSLIYGDYDFYEALFKVTGALEP